MPHKQDHPGYQQIGHSGAKNPDGSDIEIWDILRGLYSGDQTNWRDFEPETILRDDQSYRDAKLIEQARQRGPQGRAEPQVRILPPFASEYKEEAQREAQRNNPLAEHIRGLEEMEDGPSKWESILDIIKRVVPSVMPLSPLGIPNEIRKKMTRYLEYKRQLEGGEPKGLESLLDEGWEADQPYQQYNREHEIGPGQFLREASNGGPIPGYATGDLVPETTTVTASTVNPAVGQQYADLTDRVVQEGQRPYQQYGGQRIAGFTRPEAMAHQGITNYGMSGGPQGTQQAGGTMGRAGQMMSGAHQGIGSLMPSYGAMGGQFGGHAAGALNAAQLGAAGMNTLGNQMGAPGQQSNTDLSNYMSQYTKGVTDPQLAQLAEFQKMQGQELGAQSTASGNLGGMREGVQSAQIARNTSQQAADILGKSQQDAFVNAQQAFQNDRAAKMAGQQNQLTAQRAAGALGQTGYGTMGALMGQQMGALGAQQGALQQMGALGNQMGALGSRQAQLGQQQQSQQLERLNAMQGVGSQQRELQQQSMNMGYQDWQNQQNQNRANINWQMEAMGKLPYQNVEATTNYSGVPSPWNAAAGAGIQGLSLWNQMQNQNNGNNEGNQN